MHQAVLAWLENASCSGVVLAFELMSLGKSFSVPSCNAANVSEIAAPLVQPGCY